ncbi:MAG: GNAT family N-acetyltransferase [Nocardiopsaceae bacterium]|nr:GNAT family N-acetyltransferase [Nocardiopsaceae bacterium]
MPSATQAETAAVSLRVMELNDVPAAVRLHRANLASGFFVDLGDRFLCRYYRTFLTSPAGVALVAEVDGRSAGFLVGSTDDVVHRRHVMRLDRWNLARTGTASLIVRPELIARFARTRARRFLKGMRHSSPQDTTPLDQVRTGMLSHVAVEGRLRRAGVGARLVRGFIDIAKVHGVERLRLYTSYDNEAAQRFYRRLGWKPQQVLCDADSRPWVPFVLDL